MPGVVTEPSADGQADVSTSQRPLVPVAPASWAVCSNAHVPCWGQLVFPFSETGILTCNDTILLQRLLPADLEGCVQNLRETQMSYSSWF